jgi:C-terminal processing protease CtpA/Prc
MSDTFKKGTRKGKMKMSTIALRGWALYGPGGETMESKQTKTSGVTVVFTRNERIDTMGGQEFRRDNNINIEEKIIVKSNLNGGGEIKNINVTDKNKLRYTLNAGEESYILLKPDALNDVSGYTVQYPEKGNCTYEFIPGKKEKIGYKKDNGNISMAIPGSKPEWILKVLHSGAEGDDTVEVQEDRPGGSPLERITEYLKERLKNATVIKLKQFLEEIDRAEEEANVSQRSIEKRIEIRKTIIEQARMIIEKAYVHLPLKKAMHVAGPIQHLNLLESTALELDDDNKPIISNRAFHSQMISIFIGLRDLHTLYFLPSPYRDKIAFLPFLIEEYYENDERKYMVSKIIDPLQVMDPFFRESVVVTHWNGIPIDKAVAMNGERNSGGNDSARHARGLERLTIRSLRMSLTPDEDWVNITFRPIGSNESKNIQFQWFVVGEPVLHRGGMESTKESVQAALGVDVETEMVTQTKRLLYANNDQNGVEIQIDNNLNLLKTIFIQNKGFSPYLIEVDPVYKKYRRLKKKRPDQWYKFLAFRSKENPGEVYGYFRIFSFNNSDEDYFVKHFVKLQRSEDWKNHIGEGVMPKGLIIDVRGNGGGVIPAGERLLQMFTQLNENKSAKKEIEPENFHFINTPLTLKLCTNDKEHPSDTTGRLGLSRWERSIRKSIETGAVYSQGFRLEKSFSFDDWKLWEDLEFEDKYDPEKSQYGLNVKDYLYQNDVVLITDALCYSTTDIFAAGFQDNNIGKVIGVHKNTGAGGANAWKYGLLHELLTNSECHLPNPNYVGHDWDFSVAIRRSTRVGEKYHGMPLEDLGVEPDCDYQMTKNDLLNNNVDLIANAICVLKNEDKCKEGKKLKKCEKGK